MATKKKDYTGTPFDFTKKDSVFVKDKDFNGTNLTRQTAITIGTGRINYAQNPHKSKKSVILK